MSDYKKIDSYLDKNFDQSLAELSTYVAQPSISAQNLGLKECAQIVKGMLEKRGFKADRRDNGHRMFRLSFRRIR